MEQAISEFLYESEAKCKVFIIKIRFHSYVNKTNLHMKNFALLIPLDHLDA